MKQHVLVVVLGVTLFVFCIKKKKKTDLDLHRDLN